MTQTLAPPSGRSYAGPDNRCPREAATSGGAAQEV